MVTAGLHHVVDDLRQQLAQHERLPLSERGLFSFAITREKAREAIDEFHRTSCAAEALLDRCVTDLFAPGLEKILVTVGACETLRAHLPTHWHIRRSHVIGQHIPEEIYQDLLNTPDQRLSDAFRPSCPYCPHDRGSPRTHPAILSYLRHVPGQLMAFRVRLDDHDGNLQGMLYRIALCRAAGAGDDDPEVAGLLSLVESETLAKEETERVFSNVAASTGLPFAQVKTRVKGGGRLAQKIVRTALNVGADDRIKDHYGVQCVVLADDLRGARAYAGEVERSLRARDPASVLEPVRYGVSENGAWKGYKLYAAYGGERLVIPVSFQFLPLAAYWRERADHVYYEERQRRELDDARAGGKPVDAMLDAVGRELARAAQDWRDVVTP